MRKFKPTAGFALVIFSVKRGKTRYKEESYNSAYCLFWLLLTLKVYRE